MNKTIIIINYKHTDMIDINLRKVHSRRLNSRSVLIIFRDYYFQKLKDDQLALKKSGSVVIFF